jgi:hypothetical protein
MVNFTRPSLYPWGKGYWYPLESRLDGPKRQFVAVRKKNLCPLPRIDPRFLCHPARSIAAVRTKLASHRGGPGSRSGSMWGLWWTKRHWGRFSPSTSVSPANYSTNFSIMIITRGWHNRPLSGRSAEWTLIPPPNMQIKKNKSYVVTNQ